MFIVLYAHDLEGSRSFYARLGCDFQREQHGDKSPVHYSTMLSNIPLEIYPPLKSIGTETALSLGIFVEEDADVLKRELIEKYGGLVLIPDVPTTKSGIATLRDPSGVVIRLFPKA